MMRQIDCFTQKGDIPLLGTTSRSGRDNIGAIGGSLGSASLQVSPDGGTSTNEIFVEKTDWEGSGITSTKFRTFMR